MTAQASSFVLFVGGGTSDASSSLLSPSKFSMSASSDVLTSKILETIEGAKVFVIFCVFDCIKK
jgi:hypothetical protein